MTELEMSTLYIYIYIYLSLHLSLSLSLFLSLSLSRDHHASKGAALKTALPGSQARPTEAKKCARDHAFTTAHAKDNIATTTHTFRYRRGSWPIQYLRRRRSPSFETGTFQSRSQRGECRNAENPNRGGSTCSRAYGSYQLVDNDA